MKVSKKHKQVEKRPCSDLDPYFVAETWFLSKNMSLRKRSLGLGWGGDGEENESFLIKELLLPFEDSKEVWGAVRDPMQVSVPACWCWNVVRRSIRAAEQTDKGWGS